MAFPTAPAGFVDFAGNIMILKTRGAEVVFHRSFGGCIWDMLFRGRRYTQPLWGRGGSFQTAMCLGIGYTGKDKKILDSCEMYNPTMAGAGDDEGGSKTSSVVKEFKISPDGSQAFVRTQAAYYWHAGSPVLSDHEKPQRPPYNKRNLSNCFVSYWVRMEAPATLVIDVGVEVGDEPEMKLVPDEKRGGPGWYGGQMEVLTNYMPNAFNAAYRLEGKKLVRGPDIMTDSTENVWEAPARPLASATADGKHCQGMCTVSKSTRGKPWLSYATTKADPNPEVRMPDVRPHLEGRPAFGGGLSKWTITWHQRPGTRTKVAGKYAWRVKMPMGTVAEVEAALVNISKEPVVTY